MNRSSGLFLHPTSLPSRFGIGDLGTTSYKWVEMLIQMKQSFWQVCPLGPTGYGDSPYQSFCSFAGNSLLISPALLEKEGLLNQN
jgi:4-alpha-glucanotransferase